jgi:DNA uptake protein ComE-like DNA-binding protein
VSAVQSMTIQADDGIIMKLEQLFLGPEESVNLNLPTLPPPDLAIPIRERSLCIAKVTRLFRLRQRAYSTQTIINTKTSLILPVFVGLSGVGKTRLLQEYLHFVPTSGVALLIAVHVMYYNGRSIGSADRNLPIVESFAARLLHRFFCEGIAGRRPFSSFMEGLGTDSTTFPKMNIILACRTIRSALERTGRLKNDDTLGLFISIDEYHSIGEIGEQCLPELAQALVDASTQLVAHKIWLYPIFAGTEWGQIAGFDSTSPYIQRISVPLLSLDGSLAIAQFLYAPTLMSGCFVQCITLFAGVARAIVEYARKVNEEASVDGTTSLERMQALKIEVLGTFACRSLRSIADGNALVRLLAHGITQEVVVPNEPSVAAGVTWQQLENRGLIVLEQVSEYNWKVIIPHSVVVFCAALKGLAPLESGFVTCLQKLLQVVGNVVEEWKNWEVFGAYYHALRINAFLIMGIVEVPLSKLMLAATPSDLTSFDPTIQLKRAEVFLADNQLSITDDLTRVPELRNIGRSVSCIDDSRINIVVNAPGGEGVDVYFILLSNGGERLFIADQRKVNNVRITDSVARSQLRKSANVAPTAVAGQPIHKSISYYYSAIATVAYEQMPLGFSAVARERLIQYHGPLATSYLELIRVNPNTANVNTVRKLMGLTEKVAKAFVQSRNRDRPITYFEQLSKTVEELGGHPLDPFLRQFLLVVETPT